VLEEADLIVREREGQHRRCRLKQEALTNASEWLEFHRRFWSGTLDRLNDHLKQDKGDKKP
jgi:DNA-binding transcriptional ArsR family regulator